MKQSSQSASNTASSNAISLLKSDHRMVEDLFQQIEANRDADELAELVLALHTTLSVHTRIEEEIFYPSLRAASSDAGERLDEAAVEHGSAKHLLVDLSTISSDDRFFRARLKVLKEQIKHHVKEEEEQLMPMAESADIDLEALGALLSERRETLMAALEEGTRLAGARGAKATERGSSTSAQH
ncbi:MAG: hemerythrin domain-containing protein [Pseudomonadota bacterium]|nr:hemerythrin domain-containing protein [Pseudomonadota bacterium]